MSSMSKTKDGGEEESSQSTPHAITITIMETSSMDSSTFRTPAVRTTTVRPTIVSSSETRDAKEGRESLLVVSRNDDNTVSVTQSTRDLLQTVTETHMGSEELPVISNINSSEDVCDQSTIQIVSKTDIDKVDEGHESEGGDETSHYCLICNKELLEEQIPVFKTLTNTTQRKVSVYLGTLVGQKLTSRKAHSDIICPKCLSLLNKLDLLEVEVRDTKEELVNMYQETISIRGGRARRRKPAAAKKSDFVFTKIDPDDDDEQAISMEMDETFEPKVDDLLEEEHDRREDRDSQDEEWEPEYKRSKAKREASESDPRGNPKRKRGRPRKDVSKSKEETVHAKLEGGGGEKNIHDDDSNKFLKSKGVYVDNKVRHQIRSKHIDSHVYLGEPLCCAECGELFVNEPLYRIHCTEAHDPLNGIKCPHCPLVFDKRHDLDAHMINHNPINHVCKICNVGFLRGALLFKHLRSAHPDTASACARCDAVFVDDAQLQYHFNKKHKRGIRKNKVSVQDVPVNSVVCSECGKVCPSIMSYQGHKYKEHLHLFPHECEICWRRFSKENYLATHLKTHAEGTCKCERCGVKFVNEFHLVDHMYYVHGQKKTLMCNICKKFFSRPNSLKTHKEMEHRDTLECNEECEVCGEKYPTKATLKRHMLVHKQEHKCIYCGMKKTSKAALALHINMIHTKEHSFFCPCCNKEFFAKHLMQMHVQRVHSDRSDFQYKCKICSKAYLQEWMLTLHNKTHTNERNYKCEICGDAFYTVSRMRYHRATHKTTKDSECPLCAQMFRRDVDTKNHLRRVHKVANPGQFMDLCNRYGKEKAKELQEVIVTQKGSSILEEDVAEHITLYSVKEDQETPVQVIIPDGVEMMVLDDSNCTVTDVPSIVDETMTCVYEMSQVDINQMEINQVDMNQVKLEPVNLDQIQMNDVDINQVEINESRMGDDGGMISIIKIDDFDTS